jgi:hypothetical protein
MFESLLRKLWTTGWRRGREGSRGWMVVAAAAGGARLLRHVTRDKDDILYRTQLKPGDRFEVIATEPVTKTRKRGRKK